MNATIPGGEIRSARSSAILVGTVWLGSIAVFVAVAVQSATPVGVLLRDPQDTTGSPWYLGVVSTVGLIGWACAATLFLGGASILRSIRGRRTARRSLLVVGALTTLLLVDDALLVHDDWLQRSANLEFVAYGVYVIVGLGWLIGFRREIVAGPWPVGAVALTSLALSVAVDVVFADVGNDWRLLVEEGAKFAGIWTLAAYAALTAAASIAQAVAEPARVDG